jgi:hypothetical protein
VSDSREPFSHCNHSTIQSTILSLLVGLGAREAFSEKTCPVVGGSGAELVPPCALLMVRRRRRFVEQCVLRVVDGVIGQLLEGLRARDGREGRWEVVYNLITRLAGGDAGGGTGAMMGQYARRFDLRAKLRAVPKGEGEGIDAYIIDYVIQLLETLPGNQPRARARTPITSGGPNGGAMGGRSLRFGAIVAPDRLEVDTQS